MINDICDEAMQRTQPFTPLVPPELFATSDEKNKRLVLLSKATLAESDQAQEQVKEAYIQFLNSLQPSATKFLPTLAPPKFSSEHYYKYLDSIVQHRISSLSSVFTHVAGSSQALQSNAVSVDGHMVYPTSVEHRAHDLPSQISPDVPSTQTLSDLDAIIAGNWSVQIDFVSEVVDYMSSRQILESDQENLKCKYQGCLIACELEPRNVEFPGQSPRKRKSDSDTNKAVDCVFVDKTGPVDVTLWGSIAEQVCGIWRHAVETCSPGQNPRCLLEFSKMRVHAFPKNNWNGAFLTKMRQLSSLEAVDADPGTVLCVVSAPSAPNMNSATFTVPGPDYCVTNFQSLRNKLRAPFRVTLKGVVVDLLPLDHSQAGNKKRHFNIVDPQGSYISCCAMKHNSESLALQNYREIVIFFGLGRGPISSSPGMLYLMKDTMIVQTRSVMPLATPKNQNLEIVSA